MVAYFKAFFLHSWCVNSGLIANIRPCSVVADRRLLVWISKPKQRHWLTSSLNYSRREKYVFVENGNFAIGGAVGGGVLCVYLVLVGQLFKCKINIGVKRAGTPLIAVERSESELVPGAPGVRPRAGAPGRYRISCSTLGTPPPNAPAATCCRSKALSSTLLTTGCRVSSSSVAKSHGLAKC